MLYKEIIAVGSEIHTKHINTLCGQNVQLLYVKLVVHHVTSLMYIECNTFCTTTGNSGTFIKASSYTPTRHRS